MIKAFIFDHDGVIIDSEPTQIAAWTQFFTRHNIHITPGELPFITRGRTARDIISTTFPEGVDVEALANEREQLHFSLLKNDLRLIPGVREFLTEAKKRGFRLAVATSARRYKLMHALEKFGLDPLFDVIVTSEDVKKGKPDPEAFLMAASRLGVGKEECLVFEDSLKGVQAAELAGIKTVVMTTSHRKEEFRHSNTVAFCPHFLAGERKRIFSLSHSFGNKT